MSPPAVAVQLPSWRWPIAIGVVSTVVLHAPVVFENLLWVALTASFGLTGAVCGVLPAWLALRRDPSPMLSSGFAVSFISTGLGVVLLAIATLVRGFTVAPEAVAVWRDEFVRNEQSLAAVEEFFARLRGGEGDSWVVLAAAFVAFGGGMAGATVAAIRSRSRRSR